MNKLIRTVMIMLSCILLFTLCGCGAEKEEERAMDMSKYDNPFMGSDVGKFESYIKHKAIQTGDKYKLENTIIELTADKDKRVYGIYLDFKLTGKAVDTTTAGNQAKNFLPPDAKSLGYSDTKTGSEGVIKYTYKSKFLEETFPDKGHNGEFSIIMNYRGIAETGMDKGVINATISFR